MAFEVPYPTSFPLASAQLLLSISHGATPHLPEAVNAAYAMEGFFLGVILPETASVAPAPPFPLPPPGGWRRGGVEHTAAQDALQSLVDAHKQGSKHFGAQMTSVNWQLILGLVLDLIQKLLAGAAIP